MTVNSWPSHFPNNVPPLNAKDANGKAYRLVRQNPPTKDDFLSYCMEQENIEKFKGRDKKPNDYGTSLFGSLEKIKIVKGLYATQRKKMIACGDLTPQYGVMSKQNNETHFELWVREDCGIERVFKVVVK